MIEALAARGRRAIPTIVVAALASGATLSVTTLSPALAQEARALGAVVNAVVNCRSVNPCGGGVNSGTGFGVMAVSASSNGVDSATKNPSASTNVGRSAVYGHDDSTDNGTLNVGVAGFSKSGTGMQATSTTGTGLAATSTNGTGLVALSTNGLGLLASSQNGVSISAYSPATGANGNGINSFGGNHAIVAGSDGGDAIYAYSTNGRGLFSSSTNAVAVDAESSTGYALFAMSQTGFPFLATAAPGNSTETIRVFGGTTDVYGSIIRGFDSNGVTILRADNTGNLTLNGQLFTQGSCHAGCSRTRRVESYAPRESVPSIEDIGEGQLVAGTARVRLDAAFANVIDDSVPYAVFVSPEGPNHGLYVTRKSRNGFTVAENPGGRSTIPFSYRIVAKPYGVAAARLPMIETQPAARPRLRPVAPASGDLRHVPKSPSLPTGRLH